MTEISEFIEILPEYAGIFILMLSTFLVGYISASWFQRNRFRKQLKKLKKEINSLRNPQKDPRDIETIFTEIKPKIIEVVKETREEEEILKESLVEQIIPEPTEEIEAEATEEAVEIETAKEAVAQRARTTYISYNIDKPELNFDNFGYPDADNKDDLTQIMGIGPYIEQKLNEIGICTYDQISRLQEPDIRVITELIDFFPGRIERDNWVGQAKALKVK